MLIGTGANQHSIPIRHSEFLNQSALPLPPSAILLQKLMFVLNLMRRTPSARVGCRKNCEFIAPL